MFYQISDIIDRLTVFFSAFLIMIGVIIMAASTVDPWYSYWSLGLCALGAVLCVIGAIVLVPEVRENMD